MQTGVSATVPLAPTSSSADEDSNGRAAQGGHGPIGGQAPAGSRPSQCSPWARRPNPNSFPTHPLAPTSPARNQGAVTAFAQCLASSVCSPSSGDTWRPGTGTGLELWGAARSPVTTSLSTQGSRGLWAVQCTLCRKKCIRHGSNEVPRLP